MRTNRRRRAAECAHLGADTGQRAGCVSCAGAVRIKVFRCAVHGVCTMYSKIPGVASCGCDEYKNKEVKDG